MNECEPLGTGSLDCGSGMARRLPIGDLQVGRLIAHGTYGTLHEGVCDGSQVAVKQLRSNWLTNKAVGSNVIIITRITFSAQVY